MKKESMMADMKQDRMENAGKKKPGSKLHHMGTKKMAPMHMKGKK